MLESDVERNLKTRLKRHLPKALCLKLVCPGFLGVPDRLILILMLERTVVGLKKVSWRELQQFLDFYSL